MILLKGPLYFVVASRTNEPEFALREQLQWLYFQIISIITSTQLNRIFEQHRNFDLRRLLGGTEPFLDHLCSTVGSEARYILNAVHALRIHPQLRQTVGQALQLAKYQSKNGLLYGLLLVKNQLITILRPKKHSFHPSGECKGNFKPFYCS